MTILKEIKIKKITHNKETKPVYDIEVENNHHYFLENGIVSHNSGFVYASSMLVLMQKLKLKEDEDGNKVSEVRGIRAKCTCLKSRYNKPFETTTINIPYDTGMNVYSGLIDLFENKGLLVKDGNKLAYTDLAGNTDKWFRKQIIQDTSILDTIIREFPEKMASLGKDSNGRKISKSEDEEITEEYQDKTEEE